MYNVMRTVKLLIYYWCEGRALSNQLVIGILVILIRE